MSSSFIVLRYVAFALFIVFSSVICIVAALNIGALAPETPRWPEVDTYLIFLGAFGIVTVFPVIFVELIRKNAFIARVAVEVTWVALLWVMHLSGAAAITAITPQMTCAATAPASQKPVDCTSAKLLLAFTWLSTITLLSYLLGLVICTVHHHHEDSNVWRSGVRDYPWFTPAASLPTPVSSYGKLIDPREKQPTNGVYAQQIGLAATYSVEPLALDARPVPPPPVASIVQNTQVRRAAPPPPPAAAAPTASNSLSLYPQHLQATVGQLPAIPGRVSGHSPPPAGSWPRSQPQEPLPRKQRPSPDAALSPAFRFPPARLDAPQEKTTRNTSSAARPKPSGPRTTSTSSLQRVRPPPLDLSRVVPFEQARQ